ncbi:hydroxyacylglutathione hydrolase [Paucibacter sp. APW11]|uniref:Hydroxyacylglutathione hydrolase n=1 Tax=Roseateles aquae TaxID=3077235 RepID=A0ABU3P795_9BURK|nr:hydroxyacylglutathione hydrolase [Paucibacter sp. APW11]MDT8998449.1 hydroxyacylglutathione hydrolase [Paucibacter sp. APW11]
MHLLAIPAFDDNYIWMLHDGVQALVVDPGDAAPVLATLQSLSLRLAGILVTHHHGDHVGGVSTLQQAWPDAAVYAPSAELASGKIKGEYQGLCGGNKLRLLDQELSVIEVPGHTAGHIAYFIAASAGAAPLLFCGDTLFSGGCGRLFEGTPAQMHASLQALLALPADTRVCCAHEYTLSNLRFAVTVEPGNEALAAYQHWCQDQRKQGRSTLPSTLANEAAINPFLRCDVPGVQASVRQWQREQSLPIAADGDVVAIFAGLRQWKNEYR